MGSQTPRSPAAPRHGGAPDIAFDHEKSLGTFGTYQFRRSIPCPHAPLPTLHRHPHGYRCTARGESWIGSSFFPGTLTLTPPPVSLAHSHPDCRPFLTLIVAPQWRDLREPQRTPRWRLHPHLRPLWYRVLRPRREQQASSLPGRPTPTVPVPTLPMTTSPDSGPSLTTATPWRAVTPMFAPAYFRAPLGERLPPV